MLLAIFTRALAGAPVLWSGNSVWTFGKHGTGGGGVLTILNKVWVTGVIILEGMAVCSCKLVGVEVVTAFLEDVKVASAEVDNAL